MRLRVDCNAAGDIRVRILRDTKDASKISEPQGSALVCSSGLQEMTTQAKIQRSTGYGQVSSGTTFGKAARKLIREAGCCIDRRARRKCIFLTGTLPGSTKEALEALAAWSGWVAAAVQNWVRDFAPGAATFGVWEWQKRGALHLHLCVAAESESQAQQLKARWKARWIKLLMAVRRRANTDVFQRLDGRSWIDTPWITRTDAQTVEKSVGAYLSKYLSKGSVQAMKTASAPPSRWWFCSKALREEIYSSRIHVELNKLPGMIAQDMFEKLAGYIVGCSKQSFYYASEWDPVIKGVIGLLPPIAASIIFDEIYLKCRLQDRSVPIKNKFVNATMGGIALFFGGKILQPD